METGYPVRKRALEWLRCESLNLAFKHLDDAHLKEMSKHKSSDGDPALTQELLGIRAGKHGWLIDTTKPLRAWIYPYSTKGLKRGLAVYALDHMRHDDQERLVLSVDPTQPEAVIEKGIKEILKNWKQKQGRQRAAGGGDDRSLLRLWEGLQAFRRWNNGNGETQYAIGSESQSFSTPSTARNSERRGGILKELGQDMVETASGILQPKHHTDLKEPKPEDLEKHPIFWQEKFL